MSWYYVKTKNKAQINYPNSMHFNDKFISTAEEILHVFEKYFPSVFQESFSIDQNIFF